MRFSHIAMKLAFVLLIAIRTPLVEAQNQPDRACIVGDEPVMVKVQEVPNLKNLCYEVGYENKKGYLCVAALGTPERPFTYSNELDPNLVTDQGLLKYGYVGTADSVFQALCHSLVIRYREEQDRLEFDPEKAAEELSEFFSGVPHD